MLQHKSNFRIITLKKFFFIALLTILLSCNDKVKEIKLSPIEEYNIDIQEPSGLCFDETGDFIYVVSDNSGIIYKLNLQGNIVRQFSFQERDIEGITFMPLDSTLWLADEGNRSILNIDTLGNLIDTFAIEGNNEINNGLEGLSYNAELEQFYIINEKNPGQLIITDKVLNTLRTVQLDFADDYSGIFFEAKSKKLYIISDKSGLIARCNTDGEVELIYNLDEINLEGIVVDSDKIFAVSDSESKLYLYSK